MFEGILESPVYVSILVSVCVQNTGLCQSAGGILVAFSDGSSFLSFYMEYYVLVTVLVLVFDLNSLKERIDTVKDQR